MDPLLQVFAYPKILKHYQEKKRLKLFSVSQFDSEWKIT
jgi:hypothetical protein